MNKQETLAVVVLVALLMGWMWHQNRVARDRMHQQLSEVAERTETTPVTDVMPEPGREPESGDAETPPAYEPPRETGIGMAPSGAPEERLSLSRGDFTVMFSSRGGVVPSATLDAFPATREPESGPLRLDFNPVPALMLEGIPGFSTDTDFSLEARADGVLMRAESPSGLVVERLVTLDDEYRLRGVDRLTHTGATPLAITTNRLFLGAMARGAAASEMLGVDTRPAGSGEKARHWENRDLPGMFGVSGGGCAGAPAAGGAPPMAIGGEAGPQEWVAVKSKFFVQLLRSETPSRGAHVVAWRDPLRERLHIERAAVALEFDPLVLEPGETVERSYVAYIGPKQLSLLQELGHEQDRVMQFGFFRWLCHLLVPTLNFLYRLIPNYGIAIILLTLLVRVIFWPVTQRSTASMKKMQAIQPQLKALQAEHKANPQKLQQETWKIYREHKVNPMAACLPMLIQIPVFIALFTVLRSAVELRFAPFLWINDLSEPEGLLKGMIPLVGSLNILPVLMAATMAWQQRLTPATGDPQQQKMMAVMMPGMMLVMFYGMPSALVLYWTTSQIVSIGQLLLQRRSQANKTPPEASGDMSAPERVTRQMRRRQAKA